MNVERRIPNKAARGRFLGYKSRTMNETKRKECPISYRKKIALEREY